VGDGPEPTLGKKLPRAGREGLVALAERHGDEGVLRGGLVGDPAHLVGVDAHGLFHEKRIALIEQVVGRLRHATRPPERDHEVGARLGQHLSVVRVDRRIAERRRALGCDRRALVLDRDELRVGDGDKMDKIGRVVERMPVTHPDRGDAHRSRPSLLARAA
jgi:hypothetical protein